MNTYMLPNLTELTQKIQAQLIANKMTVATAESLTGGLLASAFVDNPGSSEILVGGTVVYQNKAKHDILDISYDILNNPQIGPVSYDCVKSMAENVRTVYGSDWGLATSGIAGPGGAENGKPVGTVYMAISNGTTTVTFREFFTGTRQEIRHQTLCYILQHFYAQLLFGDK